jgi:hypothetical protein
MTIPGFASNPLKNTSLVPANDCIDKWCVANVATISVRVLNVAFGSFATGPLSSPNPIPNQPTLAALIYASMQIPTCPGGWLTLCAGPDQAIYHARVV